MRVITIRSQIREVADRWARQYPGSKEDILVQLRALDPEEATAGDVAAIIGNKSWACPQQCNECKDYFPVVVQIGDEPDFESSTAVVCRECLARALAAIASAPAPERDGR